MTYYDHDDTPKSILDSALGFAENEGQLDYTEVIEIDKYFLEIADLMTEAAMLLTSLNSHHGRHDVIATLLKHAETIKNSLPPQ